MAAQHNLTLASGLLGNIVSFMVFLAPIPTFYKIYKKKTTDGFQSLPYIVALLSSMLWIYYALFKGGATFLITINSFGCVIETVYVTIFIFYAPKKTRLQTVRLLLALNVIGYGLMLVLTLLVTKGQTRIQTIGWICLVFNLCVFAAPLCIIRQVIKTKSVEFMPLPLSFFLTLGAVTWFFYGLMLKDYNIAFPNILGFIFGIAQMALYLVYKNAKVVLQEPKLQELSDHVIDVVKISALVEVNPVVVQTNDTALSTEKAENDNHIAKEKIEGDETKKETVVVVAASVVDQV
ncbi:hypothetical protein UlMin_007621 [Ulmus minor]